MKLSKSIISAALKNDDIDVYVYDVIDSTNLQAHYMIENGCKSRLLIAAEAQSDGRGRQGKSFYSPSGSGIYMSIVIPQKSTAVGITCAAAVAVAKAIEKMTCINVKIKWVNDIYVKNKKVCGILAQAVHTDKNYIIIGVGVNISTTDFPQECSDIAGSLNCPVDRNLLVAEIANNLLNMSDMNEDKTVIDEYKKRSCVIGKNISYYENNQKHNAQAVDITPDGGLEIIEYGKKRVLTSGEITLRVAE